MESQRNPLDCLRCKSTIKRPVRLPCQHYFCLDCVDSDQCHTCGRALNPAESLSEDKVLSYVVESSQEATETCANCDQISQPMFFCETCQQPLCSECRETTHKAKIFSLHHIVQLEERGRVRNRPFCPLHSEPFILFCLDSRALMCIECFNATSIERRGHFVNIDVAHKICCDKLEKSAAHLRAFQHELREQIELRRRLLEELEENSRALSEEIERKCTELVERVHALRAELLGKVVAEREEKQRQIGQQLGQFLHLESPVSVNLLSISIFCSYASKIDVLHCYAELYKAVQQFLAANGHQVQKVRFDCALGVDFPAEFLQMVAQPMGLVPQPPVGHSVFLQCHTGDGAAGRRSKKGSLERDIPSVEVLPNNFEPNPPPSFGLANDSSLLHFNPSFHGHLLEGDGGLDARFADHFQQIAQPMRHFAREIAAISGSLMDLQKDITLRRCVVTGEELMGRIACCEDAWTRLEGHNQLVQRLLNHFMGQIWRKEIERVQRQQQAVRDKVEEMKQLQRLAQRALKFSQQLKPFAMQMASLISVIDVRRCGPVVPSPMEQICWEIAQIEPDSAGRVAAIEKEEEARRQAKLVEERAQLGQREGVKMRRQLKEVKTAVPKQHRTSLVLEMDRERGGPAGSNSSLSSPMPGKKRQLQSRTHRNSESAASDTSAPSPSSKLFTSGELTASMEEPTAEAVAGEEKQQKAKPVAAVLPTPPPKRKGGMEEADQQQQETERHEPISLPVPPPPPTTMAVDQPPSGSSTAPTPPPPNPASSTAAGASILRSQTADRDPALVRVRERLLESIRERVKMVDP